MLTNQEGQIKLSIRSHDIRFWNWMCEILGGFQSTLS